MTPKISSLRIKPRTLDGLQIPPKCKTTGFGILASYGGERQVGAHCQPPPPSSGHPATGRPPAQRNHSARFSGRYCGSITLARPGQCREAAFVGAVWGRTGGPYQPLCYTGAWQGRVRRQGRGEGDLPPSFTVPSVHAPNIEPDCRVRRLNPPPQTTLNTLRHYVPE